jgi:hypothetical protein
MTHRSFAVRDVAERLAIPESAVRSWLTQERSPKVKCGRAIRHSVEEFVRQDTVPSRGSR